MYTQDYDERMASYSSHPAAAADYTYRQMLEPYLKNDQIVLCPSDERDSGWSYGPNISDVGRSNPVTGHGYLYCFRKVATFKYPAETAIFTDTRGSYWRYRSSEADNVQNEQARHNEGLNVSYLDGHAKWVSVAFVHGEAAQWPDSNFLRGGF
ncbi:MAG: hypothetical protein R6V07_14025 [Armatimonadota bacterium]